MLPVTSGMLLIFLVLLTYHVCMPGLLGDPWGRPALTPGSQFISPFVFRICLFLKVVVTQLQELRACCISVISKQGSTVVASPGNLIPAPASLLVDCMTLGKSYSLYNLCPRLKIHTRLFVGFAL